MGCYPVHGEGAPDPRSGLRRPVSAPWGTAQARDHAPRARDQGPRCSLLDVRHLVAVRSRSSARHRRDAAALAGGRAPELGAGPFPNFPVLEEAAASSPRRSRRCWWRCWSGWRGG